MIESICEELIIRRPYLNNEVLDTIYFGGGTPSLLEIKHISKILETVNQFYGKSNNVEITIEANPDDLSITKLTELKSQGINRLSIGIQSFNNKTLQYLNRVHNSEDAIQCVHNAREVGYENISIDLIFSIPGHSMVELTKDINQVITLDPEHISVYSLTIEDKTVFGNWHKKGTFCPVTDKKSAEQFDLIISRLEDQNYEQYEISNFCKNESYAKHNTSYWKNIKYLGVGPGAHSYNGASRQSNISNNHKYMKSIASRIIPCEIENLSKKELANELLLTSLRTKWGCDLHKLKELHGYDLQDTQGAKLSQLIEEGFISQEQTIIFLTRKGKFVADAIISDLFLV